MPTSQAAEVEADVDILNESLETSLLEETFIIDNKPFDPSKFSSPAEEEDNIGSGGSILSNLLK